MFLGIEVDTVAGILRLPDEKLADLLEEIQRWIPCRACKRCQLESLVGVLQHAAKVVHPGRSFVCRLINLLKGRRHPFHHIRLNRQVRADLYWWKMFAESWNGVAFFPPASTELIEFASDASGTWGCGAWCQAEWWQFQWPLGLDQGTAFKEMFAVMVAAAVWGRQWQGKQIRGHCDNQAVVHMLASRSSKNSQLMHLFRCLFFVETQFQFTLRLVHIAGIANELADG